MPTPPPADPLLGTTVSQYEIVSKVGGGGMGVVYRARDVKLGRHVALKFLPPEWSHDESAKQRFMREAQAASATQHKNICTIHNIEETPDGRLFIVMAYYEGETLKQMLERGPLPIAEAIEIASGIAEGLAKAHAQGVVHRDVKPGNIIVTEEGPKILDFGLAKFADALQLTVPGSTIGTVAYMSPEQTRGEEADARSDVWALGIVLFQMLTGRVPFHGAYPEATFYAIKNEPVPDLASIRDDVPAALVRIVTRALEKDPAARFQSAREPARDLRMLQGRTMPLELRTEEIPTIGAPLKRPAPRRRWRLAVAAAAATIIVAAGAAYWWAHRSVERIAVAIVPVANHTGVTELDASRLALTATLTEDLAESPRIRVLPYLRLLEILRPALLAGGDLSSNEIIQTIAAASGAPFLAVPVLNYRDRDGMWFMQVQIRNAATGTVVATYDTTPIGSSLSQQTALRLVLTVSDSIESHFRGGAAVSRPSAERLRNPAAAQAFARGLDAFEQLEYHHALEAFTEAVSLDNQYASAQAWVSRVSLLLGRRSEGVAAAGRAVDLAGTPRLKMLTTALRAESQGDLDGAEAQYHRLAQRWPDDRSLQVELADFLKRRQDRNQQAIEAYHAVLAADPSYIRVHVDLCQLYTRVDDYPLATREGERAREAFAAAGNAPGEAQALLCLADEQREQGGVRLDEARRTIERARMLVAANHPYALARVVFYQGVIAGTAGRLNEAAKFFEEAASRNHDVGNQVTEALSLMNLGLVTSRLGRPSAALEFYERGRAAFVQLGDERRAAEIVVNSSGVRIEHGADPDAALRALANARTNLSRLGHVDFELVAALNEADSQRYAGHLDRARATIQTALQVARDRQLAGKVSDARRALAALDLQSGDYAGAVATLEALVAENVAGDDLRIALANAHLRAGRTAQARADLEQVRRHLESQPQAGVWPGLLAAEGQAELAEGQAARARASFDAAIKAWVDPLANAASVEARCARARIMTAAGEFPRARSEFATAIDDAKRLRRLALEGACRAGLAAALVDRGESADALETLSAIPDDDPETRLDPEVRAVVEYWRGRAAGASGDQTRAAAASAAARRALATITGRLPEPMRAAFLKRTDIEPIARAN